MHGSDRRLLIFALAAGVAFLLPVAGFPAERLPPEVEAIRAERERQRAALDRIHRKVEALREAEGRGASPVPVVSPPKTPDLEREWARHEAREREREGQAAEARRLKEERLWREWRQGLGIGVLALFGAFCLLPLFPLYRDFIDSLCSQSGWVFWGFVFFMVSAACLTGASWLLKESFTFPVPWLSLGLGVAVGLLGLYFWFFVPGLVAHGLVFLHSLFVPHPLEIAFQRVLRGETISRDEAARVAEAIRAFYHNGSPADWRVKSLLLRLERLAKLMGRENAFVDFLSEYILHQHDRPESGRRSSP